MDITIMDWVQQNLHSPIADAVFPFLSAITEAGALWLAVGVVLLFFKKHRATGLLIFAAMLVTFLLGNVMLKNIIMRPRPFVTHPGVLLLVPPPGEFSMPSGHASSSFAAAAVLWVRNRRLGAAALALAALVAFSRVFLYVHWPSDVLAGAALGVLCAASVCFFYSRREKIVKIIHK